MKLNLIYLDLLLDLIYLNISLDNSCNLGVVILIETTLGCELIIELFGCVNNSFLI